MDPSALSAAAQLVLLKGPRNQGPAAMKLTIMELAAAGALIIESRPLNQPKLSFNRRAETVAWVPEAATAPVNPTLDSVFSAAQRMSDAEDPVTVFDIAIVARAVPDDLPKSSLERWVYRLPLKQLYDRDLMQTRKRVLLRDTPELSEAGRMARLGLEERLSSLRSLSEPEANPIESLLGGSPFARVRESWPDIDRFVRELKQSEPSGPSAGGG